MGKGPRKPTERVAMERHLYMPVFQKYARDAYLNRRSSQALASYLHVRWACRPASPQGSARSSHDSECGQQANIKWTRQPCDNLLRPVSTTERGSNDRCNGLVPGMAVIWPRIATAFSDTQKEVGKLSSRKAAQ